jgi:hypothetical protein
VVAYRIVFGLQRSRSEGLAGPLKCLVARQAEVPT